MDPLLMGLVTGYFTHFSSPAIEGLFSKVFERGPDLEDRLRAARATEEIEEVFREAVGVIDASAGDGAIKVDRSLLEAIRGIRFDHAAGTVMVASSTLSAPVLVTGGSTGATGVTEIRDGSELKSKGTSIKVGQGALITASGGARIIQT